MKPFKLIFHILALALFAAVLVTLEVGAFPGPWVWNRAQVLLVLFAVVIVGVAILRRQNGKV